jgi:hypothetical protein
VSKRVLSGSGRLSLGRGRRWTTFLDGWLLAVVVVVGQDGSLRSSLLMVVTSLGIEIETQKPITNTTVLTCVMSKIGLKSNLDTAIMVSNMHIPITVFTIRR